MKRRSNVILGALLLTILAAMGFAAFRATSGDPASESSEEMSHKGGVQSSRKSNSANGDNDGDAIVPAAKEVVRDGRSYILLGKGVMQHAGIEVTAIQTRSEALTVSAFGKVVMPRDLAADASMYSAAYSAYKAAASRKDASEKEYERLKTLNATKNVSDKAFQAAVAKYDADAAEVNSTLQNLLSVKTRILEKWGTVVAGWLESASSRRSSRLLEANDLLVEASLPSGAGPLLNIHYGVIVSSDGKNAKAEYLSPAPSVNP